MRAAGGIVAVTGVAGRESVGAGSPVAPGTTRVATPWPLSAAVAEAVALVGEGDRAGGSAAGGEDGRGQGERRARVGGIGARRDRDVGGGQVTVSASAAEVLEAYVVLPR